MLPLTPLPPQTDGERAFFSELARWDTGTAIRGGVVAAIPHTEGPLRRRLSDAVLLVPEGIAVIRVAEVVRQSGVVTASPEGPWTIGPAGTGGAVLQLGGGGSTPLEGLMRAGMDTAVRLRQAGLQPGRIARLTVLVGAVEGLLPTDGDLGEGDQVALLDTRSLLLGFARASRYSAVDNPRLWTTADVRAALETLGLEGRGPTVEELNGEGFPYSPYVLRRPQLLTPAAMAAAPASATPAAAVAPPALPPPEPAAPAGPTRESIDQAVAASVAAAHAAQQAAAVSGGPTIAVAPPVHTRPAVPSPVVPSAAGPALGVPTTTTPVQGTPLPAAAAPPAATPPAGGASAAAGPVHRTVAIDGPVQRDTVAVDAPPQPAPDAGIGGLFGAGEPDDEPDPPSAALPRTAVLAVQPGVAAPAAPAAQPVQSFWDRPPGDDHADGDAGSEAGRAGRTRRKLLALAAVLLLVVVGIGVALALGDRDDGSAAAAPDRPAEQPGAAGPAIGSVQEVGGVAYTVRAAEVDQSCVGHAYGETAAFFEASDCTGLARALYSAQVGGRDVVVSVSRVRMPDATAARALRETTDRNGSGNVSDLLREGVRYLAGPDQLRSAEYASALSGPTVTVVESAWVDPRAGGTEAEVDQIATDGLALTTPAIPG